MVHKLIKLLFHFAGAWSSGGVLSAGAALLDTVLRRICRSSETWSEQGCGPEVRGISHAHDLRSGWRPAAYRAARLHAHVMKGTWGSVRNRPAFVRRVSACHALGTQASAGMVETAPSCGRMHYTHQTHLDTFFKWLKFPKGAINAIHEIVEGSKTVTQSQ